MEENDLDQLARAAEESRTVQAAYRRADRRQAASRQARPVRRRPTPPPRKPSVTAGGMGLVFATVAAICAVLVPIVAVPIAAIAALVCLIGGLVDRRSVQAAVGFIVAIVAGAFALWRFGQ